jgi:purine-binding chemotaxis protein CheW
MNDTRERSVAMSVTAINKTTQYLSFELDGEIFALEIEKVREVLDYTTITTIPLTPDFMRGIINLRGRVVPVVDMRVKFGIPEVKNTVDTCIIIVEVTLDDEMILVGALVDSVDEVFDLEPDHIEPPPKIGINLTVDFIKGMGKRDDGFIIILDIDRVFSEDEISLVAEAGESIKQMAGQDQ